MKELKKRFYQCQYWDSEEKFVLSSCKDLTEYFEYCSLLLKFGSTLLGPAPHIGRQYIILQELVKVMD
jgi:hypothetical protein